MQNPTVDTAIDEIWRCDTKDFRSASHAIQMLRLAIVAEWEGQQLAGAERTGDELNVKFSYDPSDSFLSLQGATLRFHAQFESMKAEREASAISAGQRSKAGPEAGEESVAAADSPTVHTHVQSLSGVEWELTEQAAWEVWEESVRASAALIHACVGPSWRRQLSLRRRLIRETERRLLHLQHQGRFGGEGDDPSVASSTLGELSMTSTLLSMDVSNPQSSGRYLAGYAGSLRGGPQSVVSSAAPPPQPPRDILEMLSFTIPEVLPAAMIRFAASANETSIPPLRSADTKIYWDCPDGGGAGTHSPTGGGGHSESLLNSLGRHLDDERRWLRRRKRLGDTQR